MDLVIPDQLRFHLCKDIINSPALLKEDWPLSFSQINKVYSSLNKPNRSPICCSNLLNLSLTRVISQLSHSSILSNRSLTRVISQFSHNSILSNLSSILVARRLYHTIILFKASLTLTPYPICTKGPISRITNPPKPSSSIPTEALRS